MNIIIQLKYINFLRLLVFLIVCFFYSSDLKAQKRRVFDHKYFKKNHFIDISLGMNANMYFLDKSWYKLHTFNENNQLRLKSNLLNSNRINLGYGLRAGGFFGYNMNMETDKGEKFRIDYAQTIYANAGLYARFSIIRAFDFGLNSDIAGLSFGNPGYGTPPWNEKDNPLNDVRITPANGNLIGTSGTYRFEAFLSYWISQTFNIKLIYSHFFSNFKYDNRINNELDRNLTQSGNLIGFSISYCGGRVLIPQRKRVVEEDIIHFY